MDYMLSLPSHVHRSSWWLLMKLRISKPQTTNQWLL